MNGKTFSHPESSYTYSIPLQTLKPGTDYCQLMTVNSSQPLAAGDFDRLMLLPATFHEPAQLWAINPSPLLVHICGTIYHFIFVTLNYRFPSFASY